MQDVTQKRLAIVVMIVITALKISWAVGFLLKNDIFKFLFIILIIIFYLIRSILKGFFYLTRPLLLGEAPPPLLNPPLLRRWGLKAWPAGPVLANKLSPLRGCSWLSTQQSCDCLCADGAPADCCMRMPLGYFLGTEIHSFFKDTAFGSA